MATELHQLDRIQELAQEISDHALAGGNREHAFWLMVDRNEFAQAIKILEVIADKIAEEVHA